MCTGPGMLDLPAELRVAILKLIGPNNMDFRYSDYQGVYLSCKTIKREMDTQCPKRIQAKLQRIRQQPSFILLDPGFFDGTHFLRAPTKFAHLNTIRLDVHVDLADFPSSEDELDDIFYPRFMAPVDDLVSCAISRFSLRFHTNQRFCRGKSVQPRQTFYVSERLISDVRSLYQRLEYLFDPKGSPLREIEVDVECEARPPTDRSNAPGSHGIPTINTCFRSGFGACMSRIKWVNGRVFSVERDKHSEARETLQWIAAQETSCEDATADE